MLEMVKDLFGLVIAVTVAPIMNKEDKEEDMIEKINHPEFGNDEWGLTADYSLWAEFNKEQLIRKWIESSRTCYLRRGDDDIPTEGVEVECGTHMERVMAENALEELINFGHLDPVTYLKTPKADETHEVY